MNSDYIASVKWMANVLDEYRCVVNALMDDGMCYEEALEYGWPWVKPAKKRAYIMDRCKLATIQDELRRLT
jgi:hypothetical protein